MNKYFLDKAFTNNCNIYILDSDTISSNSNYLTFYCNGNITITDANYDIFEFGNDSRWKFYLCTKTGSNCTISSSDKVYISEVREWESIID
jgi:hypothetical protein